VIDLARRMIAEPNVDQARLWLNLLALFVLFLIVRAVSKMGEGWG